MRVIAVSTLRAFWERHPDAEQPLKAWYEEKRLDKEGKHSHAVYVLRKQEGIAEV